ncbi:phosphohistidine phosphatase SixA [Aliagarivorans marinus]|uniref:phosphohistidine phosphatase SixA n=1 Tax=Aliagarivorans marinus TaxID=561965 RepID=UPI000407A549|nr:phosphohistidine phosphatase SixA [Aliagarivorans marinus]
MQVFIMRHGEAEMYASSDAKRELTEQGRQDVANMGLQLAKQIDTLDYALVSPYMRAQQTWQVLKDILPACKQVIPMEELIPSGDEVSVAGLIEELAREHTNANIIVVSHLPLVGYLVEALCPGAGSPLFSTAAIAQVDLNEEPTLVAVTHPYMLKN